MKFRPWYVSRTYFLHLWQKKFFYIFFILSRILVLMYLGLISLNQNVEVLYAVSSLRIRVIFRNRQTFSSKLKQLLIAIISGLLGFLDFQDLYQFWPLLTSISAFLKIKTEHSYTLKMKRSQSKTGKRNSLLVFWYMSTLHKEHYELQ